mgnify:FL=1
MRFVKVIAAVLFVLVVLTAAGCASSQAVASTQVNARVDGDNVSISAAEVQNAKNTRFAVKTTLGETNYMAYVFDKELHVRANVCPPCRSIGFTLDGDTLVCDRCATVFDAGTGAGIKGACVDFPKAAVPYTISDGKIVMKSSDLATAYKNTLQPGLP